MAQHLNAGNVQAGMNAGAVQTSPSTPIDETLSDTFSWTDAIAFVLNDTSDLMVTLSDSFSFSDLIAVGMHVSDIYLTDTVSLGDSLSLQLLPVPINLSLGDTIALVDTLSAPVATISVNLDDTFTFVDTFNQLGSISFGFSDQLALVDVLLIQFNQAGIVLADTLNLLDSISVQVNASINVQLTDTFAFSDSISSLESTSFISYIRQYLNDVN